MSDVSITLSPEEFIVLHKIMQYIRLGDGNLYASAITELVIKLEANGAEDHVKYWLEAMEVGEPVITVEFSDDEGMVINVCESAG